ncbi:asparagine synthase-related protein [Hyphococcus sp.]|uniref:asparagine synthase-related protein n=1 Tax=Hyphococcus sp. TaxID=2038636 RepID=UPI0035C78AF8
MKTAICGSALILTDQAVPRLAGPDSKVLLLGEVFPRDGAKTALVSFSATAERDAVRSNGAALSQDYWGAYLAFIARADSKELSVFRDPSGSMGCFSASVHGLHCLFSDVEIALELGLAGPRVDWDMLARRIAYPISRDDRTCLDDVTIVLPGERRCFSGGEASASSLWDPWGFASPEKRIEDDRAAARMLAAEIDACVAAWAAKSPRPLMELSGGLDSSIIAASLAKCGAGFECVNLYSTAPGGDERRYAQAVAARAGAPLRTVVMDGARADLRRVAAIRSPNPDGNLLHELIDEALIGACESAGADAFFSGGGGDNIFCHVSTASPAADRLLSGTGLGAFAQSVRDISALNDCSLWIAARYAVRKAMRARIAHQPCNDLFLSREALGSPPPLHPWFQGPPDALPGKREHVASVAFALWNADTTERSRVAPMRYPLMSQPVAELALRIPAWMWVRGGRDRAVARAAFGTALPDIVVNRRTKGDLTGFMTELYRCQRPLLQEILLDGALAKARIIDRVSVERRLSSEAFPRQRECGTLLALAKTDVWAQSWAGGPRGGGPKGAPLATF